MMMMLRMMRCRLPPLLLLFLLLRRFLAACEHCDAFDCLTRGSLILDLNREKQEICLELTQVTRRAAAAAVG